MAVPIAQIHALHAQGILTDSSPLEEVVGTVKNFYPPKAGEYGPMQNLVLGDETGEIQVMISGRQGDPITALPPIQRGNMLTLFSSVNGKQQRVGLVKKSYDGRAQLKVSASNVRNASAPVATQAQAYGAPAVQDPAWMSGNAPAPAQAAPRPAVQPSFGPGRTHLGESEARRLWLRQVYEMAAAYSDVGTHVDVAEKLPPHVFTALAAFATSVLIGVQRGDVAIEEGLRDEVEGWGDGANPAGGDPWGA